MKNAAQSPAQQQAAINGQQRTFLSIPDKNPIIATKMQIASKTLGHENLESDQVGLSTGQRTRTTEDSSIHDRRIQTSSSTLDKCIKTERVHPVKQQRIKMEKIKTAFKGNLQVYIKTISNCQGK